MKITFSHQLHGQLIRKFRSRAYCRELWQDLTADERELLRLDYRIWRESGHLSMTARVYTHQAAEALADSRA